MGWVIDKFMFIDFRGFGRGFEGIELGGYVIIGGMGGRSL